MLGRIKIGKRCISGNNFVATNDFPRFAISVDFSVMVIKSTLKEDWSILMILK